MKVESFHYQPDRDKWLAREKLIANSPDLAISIDTSRLKRIIPYDRFLCHCYSSVALGHAITGSDVDGGLVVLKQNVSDTSQLAFIQELRRQRFNVYHANDFFAARSSLDQYKAKAASAFGVPYHELNWDQIAYLAIGQNVANRSDAVNNIFFRVIRFHTEKELSILSRDPAYPDYTMCQDREVEIFRSGFQIK